MPGEVHQRLVEAGRRWLIRQGFAVVAAEITVAGTAEQPDVIGFRSSCSVVVEAKASRSDFLADRRKPHRSAGGLGVYRFYLCMPGMIDVDDLPARWGLLLVQGRSIVMSRGPAGNIWPANESGTAEWRQFQHQVDAEAERRVLYSIARRRSLARSDEIYEDRIRTAESHMARLAAANDSLREEVRKLRLQQFNEGSAGESVALARSARS